MFPLIYLLFMVWNAVNDPLFGWLSDTTSTANHGGNPAAGRRVPYIRIGGWWLAGSFIFAWFPWTVTTDW